MDKKINVAIIGCGKIGYHGYNDRNIDSHYKALTNSKISVNFEIDLFDTNSNVAYGPFSKAPKSKYDAIIIAVNTENHLKIYQEALNKHPELIILEKPAGNSLIDFEKIKELGHKKTIVNYFRRLNGDYDHIKSLIESGAIGDTKHVEIIFNKKYEINGCHFIDLIVYFYGPPLNFRRRGNNYILYYPGFECNVNEVNLSEYVQQHIHIYGNKSKIELNHGGMEQKLFEKTTNRIGVTTLVPSITYIANNYDSCMHIPNLITKYTDPNEVNVPSNLEDAYHTAKIIYG